MKKILFLFLISAVALGGCSTTDPTKKKEEEVKKRAKAQLREENNDVDFQAFVSRLKKAVAAHDKETLALMMPDNFLYFLGATQAEARSGKEGAFKYWDENGLWPELDGILTERFVKVGDPALWVAPPQFGDESLHYTGYRAGVGRIGGSWKFVYFVNGATAD